MSVITLLGAAALAAADVNIPGPKGPLAATLIDPARTASASILIPGSGPTDRDGNNPAGVSGGIYGLLSEQLAGQGIATLRIDKRGMFGSKAAIADANAVTIADNAWLDQISASARQALRLARRAQRGGIVALAAAQQPEGICGLILLATPGRPLGAVLRAQLKPKLRSDMFSSADAAISRLERRQRVDPATVPAPLAPLFNPAVQNYLIDLMTYNPARLAAATRLPMLIIQGDNDIQVGVDDARLLAATRPGARLVLIPGVNHVWRKAPADAAANAATYRNARIPVDPSVATAIAAFLKAKR